VDRGREKREREREKKLGLLTQPLIKEGPRPRGPREAWPVLCRQGSRPAAALATGGVQQRRGGERETKGRGERIGGLPPPSPRTAQASGLGWPCCSLAAAREAQETAPVAVTGAG